MKKIENIIDIKKTAQGIVVCGKSDVAIINRDSYQNIIHTDELNYREFISNINIYEQYLFYKTNNSCSYVYDILNRKSFNNVECEQFRYDKSKLYFCYSDKIYCINAHNYNIEFTKFDNAPIFIYNDSIIFYNDYDCFLYSESIDNKSIKWQLMLSIDGLESLNIYVYDDILCVVCENKQLRGISLNTGDTIWSIDGLAWIYLSKNNDKRFLYAIFDNDFIMIDSQTGKTIVHKKYNEIDFVFCPNGYIADEYLYFNGIRDNKSFFGAINLSTYNIEFIKNLDDISYSESLIYDNKTLYVLDRKALNIINNIEDLKPYIKSELKPLNEVKIKANITQFNVTTNEGKSIDMVCGKDYNVGIHSSLNSLDPKLSFCCCNCGSNNVIDIASEYTIQLYTYDINMETMEYVDFIKKLSKKSNINVVMGGPRHKYALEAYTWQYVEDIDINIMSEFILYRCPQCGSLYAIIFRSYGGDSDRMPVYMLINGMYMIELDNAFFNKYFKVENNKINTKYDYDTAMGITCKSSD